MHTYGAFGKRGGEPHQHAKSADRRANGVAESDGGGGAFVSGEQTFGADALRRIDRLPRADQRRASACRRQRQQLHILVSMLRVQSSRFVALEQIARQQIDKHRMPQQLQRCVAASSRVLVEQLFVEVESSNSRQPHNTSKTTPNPDNIGRIGGVGGKH
jgi:hypothetical protein